MTTPAPLPSDLGAPAPGSAREAVDEALSRLQQLSERPVTEHVAIYEDVHRLLQDALADVDGA